MTAPRLVRPPEPGGKRVATATWVDPDGHRLERGLLWEVADGGHVLDVDAVCGDGPEPWTMRYRVEVDADWATRRLTVVVRSGNETARWMVLSNDAGQWSLQRSGSGSEAPIALDVEALDVDVQGSPATNLMPTRRVLVGGIGRVDVNAVLWVTVPGLEVDRRTQRYELLAHDDDGVTVGYRSGAFEGSFTCAPNGLVRRYPGVAVDVDEGHVNP